MVYNERKSLISNLVETEDKNKVAETIFDFIREGSLMMVKKILENIKIDVNALYDYKEENEVGDIEKFEGVTFMWVAARNNKMEIMRYLFSVGADPDQTMKNGNTVLHDFVTHFNFKKFLQIFVDNKADLDILSNSGLTLPLEAVFFQENTQLAFLILDKGSSVNKKWYNKKKMSGLLPDGTLLIYSVYEDREKMAKNLLYKYGADANIPTSDSIYPIHYAVVNENIGILEDLIIQGADINSQDIDGLTALHYAAFYGDTEIVKFLIEKGADIEIQDYDGNYALDYARKRRATEMYDILSVDSKEEDIRVIHESVVTRLEDLKSRLGEFAKKAGKFGIEMVGRAGPIGLVAKGAVKVGAGVSDVIKGDEINKKKPIRQGPSVSIKKPVKDMELDSGVVVVDEKDPRKDIDFGKDLSLVHGKDKRTKDIKGNEYIFAWNRYGWDLKKGGKDGMVIGFIPERKVKPFEEDRGDIVNVIDDEDQIQEEFLKIQELQRKGML